MRLTRGYKVCRSCRYILPKRDTTCPACGGDSFSDRWRGLILILDKDSSIAKLMGIEKEGYYAVKVL